MKHILKRIYCFGAVLGMLSGIVSALPAPEIPVFAKEVMDIDIPTSGECGYYGDNVTWSFSGGTLTIQGSGKMDYNYYNSSSYVPWYPLRDKITKVVFGEGVTDTGDNTFCGCTNLTSVTLSGTIETIGWCAFSGCTSLKNITIPDSVTYVCYSAFSGCTSLTDIVLPDVTFDAEYGKINASLTFDESVFSGCISLSNAMVEYILAHMMQIPSNAFYGCTGLTSLIIPDCVQWLGRYCFNGCINLESLTLSSGLETISECALAGISGLLSLTVPEGVTTLDEYALNGCSNMKVLSLPKSLTKIGWYVTGNCDNLTDVYYAGTEAEWYAINNQDGCALDRATIHYESESAPAVIKIKTPNDGPINIKWSSDIFKGKSNVYHQELAKLGIALSTSAYDKEDKDNSGFHIQQAYRDALKCKDYRLYSYPNAGLRNNPNNVKGLSDADFAFSIAHTELGSDTVLFVTLRGTHTPMEWYYDLKESGLDAPMEYHGLNAAKGFAKFAVDVENGLKDYLSDHSNLKALASKDKLKVLITGHSLGAAGANLFTYAVNGGYTALGAIKSANVFAYTFATPNTVFLDTKTTNTLDRTNLADNIYNVCNQRDIVTTVPTNCLRLSFSFLSCAAKLGHGYIFDSGYKDSSIGNVDVYLGTDGHCCDRYINAVVNNFLAPDNTQRTYVRCPVDVEIYCGNELVGRTVNNVVDEDVTTVPLAVLDDEKIMILPNDAVYDVRIKAFDKGTMSFCAITENEVLSTAKGCENIVLTEGKEMNWKIREGATAAVTPLLVTDETGKPIKKILSDGSEADFTADLAGDVNNDGEFNIADLVLFQKYLMNMPDGSLGYWQLGDANKDGVLNVVDLTMMKRELIN